jgi:hypothetical protein
MASIVTLRARYALTVLFWLWLMPAGLRAGPPTTWIPARWDGGPLEAARRSKDKALADPEVREVISQWYSPATLNLLTGSPINCLLLTFSAGADPELERQQQQLVKEYARRARERGLAALGLVYAGADPSAVASAAVDAQLDGLVLEGEFPGGTRFAEQLEKALRSSKSAALVITVAPAAILRKAPWPILAAQGVPPGVGQVGDVATASATSGMWIDSNIWLVRSFGQGSAGQPIWISQRPHAGSPGAYVKSIADAAAAGGRWIVALDDGFRAKLFRRETEALDIWRSVGVFLAFFEDHAEWRSYTPFGTLGIILDAAGPNLAVTEECLNLVARRQIPYRVIDRSQLGVQSLTGLRAVLAFDLAPPTEAERKTLRAFAAEGGLVLGGRSWGTPPKDQSYTVVAVGKGEVAVYKEDYPQPESLGRDLNDLLSTGELGVSVFNAPSVLSYVSTSGTGNRMLIQLINYAGAPAESLTIWVTEKFNAARLYAPESAPVDLAVRHSGSRTEIAVPTLPVYGALLLE